MMGEFTQDVPNLTPRERQVLALVLQGLPAKEIAHQLGIGYVTVRKHEQRLREKYGTRNRNHLLVRANESQMARDRIDGNASRSD